MPTLQDTGLGWAALDSGLRFGGPSEMCKYGGLRPTAQMPQLPKNLATAQDVLNGGLVVGTRAGGERIILGVEDDFDVYIPLYMVTSSIIGVYPIALERGETSAHRVIRVQTTADGASVGSWSYYTVRSMHTYQGITYYTGPGLSYSDLTPAHTPYNTLTDLENAIVANIISDTIYKLNPGYAVCCIAKWVNLEGETVSAPVLISSDPDYTALSLDGSSQAATQTSFGFRRQGMSFTCTLIAGYPPNPTSLNAPFEDFTAAFPNPIGAAVLAEAVATFFQITVLNAPDPYGGDAQPGGGEGNPDEDEEIDFSTPPTVGSYVGFFRMWNPTETELRQLASWMWSSAFDLDTFKRIFSAPIDAILGLSLVPVQPAGIGGYTIVLGGIDTQISAFTVTNRYVTLNCGSLTVDERWGAYLDYAPYTKMSIFLPYIGFRDISTDDVMGKTVELQYTVDVLSGACVAELKCGGSVLYSWQGNCAQQLPITSADWSNALSAALGLAGTAATAIVTGGGSLPLAGTVASATVNALSLKPRMERGGSISGAAGAMAGQVPYLVRERPEQAVPGRQNHFIGYPSFTTVTLGSIAGYTEVESIHLEGIPATAAELSELESILKEGFIL